MNCISAHRPHAHVRRADRRADIAASEIGVSMTRALAELLDQSVGDLERAAVGADVLAHHEHALVTRHLVEERLPDRLEIGNDRHRLRVCRSACRLGCQANGDSRTPAVGVAKSSPA